MNAGICASIAILCGAAGCGFTGHGGTADGAGQADAPPGTADAPPGTADAPPGTADAPPGTADAGLNCPVGYNISISFKPLSRYHAVDAVNDWLSAAGVCAAHGSASGANTHLAVLSDAVERSELGASGAMDRVRWIGLSDRINNTVYRAVTDEIVAYPEVYVTQTQPPWKGGEPDNSGDCVWMEAVGSLVLEDRSCTSDDEAILCECDQFPNDPTNY